MDRRARRREETIREILDLSVEVMAEEGVAALSLAEVARRMGMRTPSLYQYFPSKTAIYDALFGQSARDLNETLHKATAGLDALDRLRIGTLKFVEWTRLNPVRAQLLFWRPVPGFVPSAEAFAPAVDNVTEVRTVLEDAVADGLLHPGAATDEGVALLNTLVAGVVSQQMSNEPEAPVGEGRFERLAPTVLDLFITHYAPHGGGDQP
ncbi:TetR family transcriptional regulator [Planotetraspora phitsanulokensis]|uniref:TetR family transcriptional regulator n=1 Tax=Planotetraspora phitsanulokensis TaxID=575192 RepID=A0A8J3UAK4_9ACTN|nr:TetR/AcrR family transcriptional regulator [Planotetraspora phitsanulokensis]GII41320.1 TetR family transcriptional regulator [Planotetraspora phitsanulokensis]